MQTRSALAAYQAFMKRAQDEDYYGGGYGGGYEQPEPQFTEEDILRAIQDAQQQEDIDAFNNPHYESPLESKRRMQGTGSLLGGGLGTAGGALAGALLPKSTLGRIAGGIGGGLAGGALGSLGGWGLGAMAAKKKLGLDYPEEKQAAEGEPEEFSPEQRRARNWATGMGSLGGFLGPTTAAVMAPKGEGGRRFGATTGWGALGATPGALAAFLGLMKGNPALHYGGVGAGILGGALGIRHGMTRAMRAENKEKAEGLGSYAKHPKTASQIAHEFFEKSARARWKQELAPMFAGGAPQVSPEGNINLQSTVAGSPEQMANYRRVENYRKGYQTADPLRGGTQTLERNIASQQLKNPGMSRQQAWAGPRPGQLPGSNTGVLRRAGRWFGGLPTAGKLGIGAGAALGLYGLLHKSKPQEMPQQA